MKQFWFLTGLALVLTTATASADDAATEQLVSRLQGLTDLQGKFSQTQYAADDELAVSASSGSFKLLKPAYFIWEINSPDSQLIVTDGQYLWHHDRDLETVTRRPVAGREEMSPLQVLAGDTAVLGEKFDVTITGEGRYRLQPLEGNPGFRDLTLIFAANTISGMEILDNLDQRLFIQFTDVDSNPDLSSADFRFEPPEGADLFYHEQ